MKDNPQRLYYLDWLRVLAMLSIFFFHADRFFDFYDWHVKNEARNIISSIHNQTVPGHTIFIWNEAKMKLDLNRAILVF
jgi:peptidoglycan/LPS O-acetylase OafA/YrhL